MGRGKRSDTSRSSLTLPHPGEGPRATTFECGPDTFAILSFPAGDPALPDSLSAAEKEVCLLLLAGATNAEVAERRRTAVRTVANQVASILRKLGAGSRSELPRALARHHTRSFCEQ
jgi:DNA-binding CsgD family transcriptional regulator